MFVPVVLLVARIIGIDYGLKRTGVAVSDPLGIFAQPLDYVPSAKIVEYLKNYAKGEGIQLFVVGYPKRLNNTASETTESVDKFVEVLKKHFSEVPVVLEDERLTTIMAHRAMIDGGMKKSERALKGSADKVSAALILQSYLDRQTK